MFAVLGSILLALAALLGPSPMSLRIIHLPPHARDGPHPTAKNDGQHLTYARDCELLAACLGAGLTLAAAADAVARATEEDLARVWAEVAALSRMGAPAASACAPLISHPPLVQLATTMSLALDSGVPIAPALAQVAQHLRKERTAAATAAARRATVLITIPLAACFLPAFFLLGLAPTVVSLASAMFAQF